MAKEEEFEDIRPYKDEEVPEILHRLGHNKWLFSGLRAVFLPKTPRILTPILDRVLYSYLRMKLKNIRTVEEFQRKIIVDTLLNHLVRKTIDGLSYHGLENLEQGKSYLFITNHRDIILDPALLNYILIKNDFPIAQIAFGDNLLINDVVGDLIRLNRGFIVKRNLPLRQQFEESLRLSRYINYVLTEKGESIWLAQRSGRAKDGIDATQSAVLKMIHFARRKEKVSFKDFVNNINIVPVSISYEYDPCDRMKAWEVYRKRTHGQHNKRKYEDLVSMLAGIKGFKGRVHYRFHPPMKGEYSNEKELAETIDTKIQSGYNLWATNFIAYDQVYNTDLFEQSYSHFEKQRFFLRFRRLSDEVRKVVLESYANPVIHKMRTNKQD